MAFNTGNPLGSTDFRDLHDNAENLDLALNGTDPTFTDRLGVERQSFAGMDLAFAGGGRFAGVSSTPPTTRLDGSPLQEGDEYQDSDDHLRYNWTGSAWVALNSSAAGLETRLADPTDPANGAGMVGFRQPLANAVGRTVAGILTDGLSILNWVPPSEHAAIKAGTSTFDCGPAIRAAIAAIAEYTAVYFPYGTYLVSKSAPGDSEAFSINKTGVVFFGEGRLKRAENNTGYFARIAADSVQLRDLILDGNRGAAGIPDSSGFGATIRSAGFEKAKILNCAIVNSAGQGISAGAGCNSWIVQGNYLENFFSNAIQFAAEASDTEGFNFVRIAGNHIKGDLPSASRFCNGIFLTSSATTTAQNTHFCDFNTVSGNFVEDVPDAGIESGYKCRYSVIEGNTVVRSFNSNILIRDNLNPIVSGNNIFCRTGHASTAKHGILVDGLSIAGDANPITDCYGNIFGNTVANAETSGISVIASENTNVCSNNITGVSTGNGSSGVNIKSGYCVVSDNKVKDFQFLIRFSLESTRPLGNQINLVKCHHNMGVNGASGIHLDASSVAMALIDCEVGHNRFKNLTTNTLVIAGTPTYFNSKFFSNTDVSNSYKVINNQAASTSIIQTFGGHERNNAAAQFGEAAAFDKLVSGVVSIKMGNETALFKTEADGAITAISESTSIGVVGSGKLYRLELSSGIFVVKRYDPALTYATFKASLS